MHGSPLVSVICLCYNQAPYVAEALHSVWAQTYAHVELIVVDDASTDGSAAVIRACLKGRGDVPFLALEENIGNCAAFNRGLALARGVWVVDLAADDVMLPHRLERQMALAPLLPDHYGVLFSDASFIDAKGHEVGKFYPRDKQGDMRRRVPQGRVFSHLLRQAFICTPTMLMRKATLDALGGYDESLSYEDYDFWVRSGRKWRYAFQPEVLMQKRLLPQSHGQQFYARRSAHLHSTLAICRKAMALVRTKGELEALAHSVRYHMRQALWNGCPELLPQYAALLPKKNKIDRFWLALAPWKLPLHTLYALYRRWRKH